MRIWSYLALMLIAAWCNLSAANADNFQPAPFSGWPSAPNRDALGILGNIPNAAGGVATAADTLVNIEANFHPVAAPATIQTTGYSAAGDLGDGLYVTVAGKPSHTCRLSITLAAGATQWYSLMSSTIRPEQCGPTSHTVSDSISATNNTNAIQNAVNYFNTGGSGSGYPAYASGIIEMSGYYINNTITVPYGNGITFRGKGWGTAGGVYSQNSSQTYLSWVGSAGVPMLLFNGGIGGGIEDMQFNGNIKNSPSAALQFQSVGESGGLADGMHFHNLSIGGQVAAGEFQRGIYFTGLVNGDTYQFDGVTYVSATSICGICSDNPNASVIHFGTVNIKSTPIGVQTNSQMIFDNLYIFAQSYDVQLNGPGSVTALVFGSEASAALLQITGTGTAQFVIYGGAFQVQSKIGSDGVNYVRSDGVIIDTSTARDWVISLNNFSLITSDATGLPNITFGLYNPSTLTYGSFAWRGGTGLMPAMLNLGPLLWNNDMRTVIYEPGFGDGPGLSSQKWIADWYHTEDRSFRSRTNYFDGEVTAYGGPLRVLATPVLGSASSLGPSAAASLGSGVTKYTYVVTTLDREGNECLPSSPFTVTNASSLSASTTTNTIGWTWGPGIASVNIYGRKRGSLGLLANVSWDSLHSTNSGSITLPAWVDNGSITPGAPPPTTCKSGSIVAEGSVSAAGGFVGSATGADAPAGMIGERPNCSGSAVSQPTSGMAINVCSISLSAGDWLCRANDRTNPASTTTQSRFAGGINTASAAVPSAPGAGVSLVDQTLAVAANTPMAYPMGETVINASSATTTYLVANAYFANSNLTHTGFMECVRWH